MTVILLLNYLIFVVSSLYFAMSERKFPIHQSRLLQKSKLANVMLPPPIRSNEPGTWAFDTMSRRIATEIFPRIIKDNEKELTRPTSSLRSECLFQLNDLLASLQSGSTGQLRGISDAGHDIAEWDTILSSIPEDERNWLDSPWIISEFYFYRRINEAFKFFETGYDMFVPQKVKGLIDAMPTIDDICRRLPGLLSTEEISNILEVGVQTSLWGNKMDLSLWPAAASTSSQSVSEAASNQNNQAGKISYGASLDATRPYILEDHTKEVLECILTGKDQSSSSRHREIGIIVDNAGYELFSDLLLGHIIISLGLAETITFHTKAHPTFVSDATTQDVIETIEFLCHADDTATRQLGESLKSHLESNSFQCIDDVFWCQPTAFWDMPERIQNRLAGSTVVFVKGDANYRRLLGDRHWPLDTPSKDILSYWPVPVCPLRTFKAEIGCGITQEAQNRAYSQDKSWMVSGRWGVVQFGGGEN